MRIIEWSSDVCSSDLPYGVSACSISPCDLAWRGNGIGAARRLMDVPFISHNNLEFQMHVIDPNNVEPTINQASAEHRDGRQVHRRILSPIKGGPASIDVGFNRTAEGLDNPGRKNVV